MSINKKMMTNENIDHIDMDDAIEKFKSFIEFKSSEECWDWKGSILSNGRSSPYGLFSFRNMRCRSHRFMWYITYGMFPKLLVCHKCDNTLCCNPNHLFLGSPADNHRDMKNKGRGLGGERHPSNKLSKSQAEEIKSIYNRSGITQKDLGKMFGVSKGCVAGIVYGTSWKGILNGS